MALEAVKGEKKTKARIASKYVVHPNQIGQWKKRLLEELPALFSDRRRKEEKEGTAETNELYHQIGQLKMKLDWPKKSQILGKGKRALIEPGNQGIPLSRRCRLFLASPRLLTITGQEIVIFSRGPDEASGRAVY